MEVIGSAFSEIKLRELPHSGASSEPISSAALNSNELAAQITVAAEQELSDENKCTENDNVTPDTSSNSVIAAKSMEYSTDDHGFSLHRIDSKSISSQASSVSSVSTVERSASDSHVSGGDASFTLSRADTTGDTSIEIHLLRSRCRILEESHKELEGKNRTLEYDMDRLRAENQQINTKLMSIMSAVAKLSAQTRHSATTASGQQVRSESRVETQNSDDTQSEIKKPVTESQQPEGAVNLNEKFASLAAMEGQMLGVTQKLTENEREMMSVKSHLEAVDTKADWLESELQRYVRRHSIIIENFCPKEDRSASEIFLLFVNSVLGVQLDDSDIDSLHLIDRATGITTAKSSAALTPEKRPRPVLVTFACYRARAQVYRAWLTFRTSSAGTTSATSGGSLSGERGQGLCIREFLTEQQEAVYFEALDAREKKLVSDCWTFKGKTFVRTVTGEIREFINKEQSLPREENKYSACSVM